MANYRQAPKLIHVGNKVSLNKNMLIIPQDIAIIICSTLSGKNGNALKLLMFFIGTIGDGSFKISESWIMKSTGMMKTSYINARKTLCDLGWIELEKGSIKLNFNEIRKCKANTEGELEEELGTSDNTPINNGGHITEIEVTSNNNRVQDTEELGSHDLSYNKDIINNNKDIVINKDEFFDFYFNLSNYYFIQTEEVRKRIDKKLPDNVDRLDVLTFWINIKDELALIRSKQKINDKCALEYDASIVLNKYNEYCEKPALTGYKMYKKDMIRIYDREFCESFWNSQNTDYFYFRTNVPEIRQKSKGKYQLSTYMFYRNAQEALLEKKKKQEIGEYEPKDY